MILSAILVCAISAKVGWRADLPALLVPAILGPALAHIDVALRRLPDPLTFSAGAATLALLTAASVTMGLDPLSHALAGMITMLLLYGGMWFIAPDQLGFGDVKLSASLGLILGWLGLRAFGVGVIAIHTLGLLVAGVLIATRRASVRDRMAFGPVMIAGTLTSVLIFA